MDTENKVQGGQVIDCIVPIDSSQYRAFIKKIE